MKKRFSLILLIAITISTSCNKDDFITNQEIRFINYTDLDFDTITLKSNYYNSIEFYNLKAYNLTDFLEISDLDLGCYISLTYNDTAVGRNWQMPSYVIDPAGEGKLTRCPSGRYTFGIFIPDTFSITPMIVLESFSH